MSLTSRLAAIAGASLIAISPDTSVGQDQLVAAANTDVCVQKAACIDPEVQKRPFRRAIVAEVMPILKNRGTLTPEQTAKVNELVTRLDSKGEPADIFYLMEGSGAVSQQVAIIVQHSNPDARKAMLDAMHRTAISWNLNNPQNLVDTIYAFAPGTGKDKRGRPVTDVGGNAVQCIGVDGCVIIYSQGRYLAQANGKSLVPKIFTDERGRFLFNKEDDALIKVALRVSTGAAVVQSLSAGNVTLAVDASSGDKETGKSGGGDATTDTVSTPTFPVFSAG
jgi:hypothetical protein